jgi:20S proteasome alpha/beta subunit
MDTVLGITYNGGVIIAADQSNGRSILTYQKNLDKIAALSDTSMMGVSGPNCDLVNFTQYVTNRKRTVFLLLVVVLL